MHPQPVDSAAIARSLRELPPELAPPMGFEEFQRRAAEAPAKRNAWPWRRAALAAGVVGLIAGIAIWTRLLHPISTTTIAAAELPMLALPDQRSLDQAQASEQWLARLPDEPAIVRVGTRSAVADLEDRIAWMDDVLSAERPTHRSIAHRCAST